MATVTVLKLPTADGAQTTLAQVQRLQQEQLIKLYGAAVVSWPIGDKSPKDQTATALYGMAVGAVFGGSLPDSGIDDECIKRVRTEITEGTSALFLMTSDAVLHLVVRAMKAVTFEIVSTNFVEGAGRAPAGRVRHEFARPRVHVPATDGRAADE
jgi:uncharacterized membrane protein